MNQIILLAATRMLSGVCIGGIADDGKWVRPVKERGGLLLGDIMYADRRVMQAFDVVHFPVLRPRPQPPHVEDCLSDFIRTRPRLVRHLDPGERCRAPRDREELLVIHGVGPRKAADFGPAVLALVAQHSGRGSP